MILEGNWSGQCDCVLLIELYSNHAFDVLCKKAWCFLRRVYWGQVPCVFFSRPCGVRAGPVVFLCACLCLSVCVCVCLCACVHCPCACLQVCVHTCV